MADINAILDGTDGDEALNLNDLDEKEVLGDDEEDQHQNQSTTKEEVEDLYDEAMAPSGALSEKRESAEVISSLPSSIQHKSSFAMPMMIKSEPGIAGGSQSGKRYCCYIGNMTWWTTDDQLQKLIQTLGVDDMIDVKFYENRNNGQSKGFALAVFASEPSVKAVMEKLPSKKLHEQSLAVLPYTKQSLAKLEEATKRYDQKSQKDEKVVNIGTVRIGTNGAPVPQLMSSINLAQLSRPVSQSASVQPTSLLSLNFPNAPAGSRPPPTVSAPAPGLVVSAGTAPVAAVQQQQQQMAVAAAASLAAAQQQHSLQFLQQQQRQQQLAVATAMPQHHQQLGGGALGGGAGPPGGISVPPPNIVVQQHPQHHQPHHQPQQPQVVAVQQQQQAAVAHAALQNAMSRPPPAIHQSLAGVNTAAPPPAMTMAVGPGGGLMSAYQQQQRQPTMMTAVSAGHQMMASAQPMHAMQPPPGFPPGAHINPQVYPGYGATAYMDNGSAAAMISEAEFQEIMNRNQTVSSSAIHRAVSDAASGDYASAIETLVTAISLIRQSRVAHDDRCKLLVNTLQDTLKGIEAQSYNGGGAGLSRKHRVRDRSRSPIRSSKRHRRSRSRSRSRDYSPMRYSSAVSSRRF
ncbi:hypothetical protein niasHT_022659 [Heterodera trifolii]|uniref:RRM domain-containing protein n=1 Tax=Heterodera trifolii TaxID=157864 RepID=A0ABD2JRG1_9BILA